jgi:quercetin dioxygenase-like cupin family protein
MMAAASLRQLLPSLRPKKVVTVASTVFTRNVTNATRPDYIPFLQLVQRVPPKPGNWHPTLIHSSGTCKFTVIRVPPGGEVPNHAHSKVWDYFVPLSGRGVITTASTTKSGSEDGSDATETTINHWEMQAGSFLAVPAGDVHVVRNVDRGEGSGGEEFVFLICQSPRQEYDFVAVEEGRGAPSEVEEESALRGEDVWDR